MQSLLSWHEGEDNFSLERRLYLSGCHLVAGTDEAGRGPLAGPVVAAAVILPSDCDPTPFIDSKKLHHNKRLLLRNRLEEIGAQTAVGISCAAEIDKLNILQASLLAMQRAILALTSQPDFVLIDGKFTISHDIPQQAFIKGESKSASIAAASIVAKTVRDEIMVELDKKYPLYNFAKHKGYPTKAHREAIARHGICPEHRKSFRRVKEYA